MALVVSNPTSRQGHRNDDVASVENDRTATSVTPEDRNPISIADVEMKLPFGLTSPPQHDHVLIRLIDTHLRRPIASQRFDEIIIVVVRVRQIRVLHYLRFLGGLMWTAWPDATSAASMMASDIVGCG